MTDPIFGEPIFSYSRREAIADGVLVDVSEMGREAGFTIPVALTAAAFGRYVQVPEGVECQDEKGRLWDILWMGRLAAGRAKDQDELLYELLVRNDNRPAKKVKLKMHCGPGDQGEPVLTIMLPDED